MIFFHPKQSALTAFVFSVCVLIFALSAPRSYAQDCNVIPELITTFTERDRGDFNLWDASYGEVEDRESLNSGFTKADGRMVLAGHINRPGSNDLSLQILEIDNRGRERKRKIHDIPDFLGMKRLINIDNGFWAIGAIRRNGKTSGWVGMFNEDFEITDQKVITDPDHDLLLTDLEPIFSGTQYVMAANILPKERKKIPTGRLYFLDSNLNETSKRSYNFGVENAIEDITILGNRNIAVAGRSIAENNLNSGWVMITDPQGKLIWQRAYSRGSSSRLRFIEPYGNGQIILGGQVQPSDGSGSSPAAWVMMLNTTRSEPLWQRYYTGRNAYNLHDIHVYNSGLIDLVISAGGLNPLGLSQGAIRNLNRGRNRPDYAHTIRMTLSPRGILFDRSVHYDNAGTKPAGMFLYDRGQRAIFGNSIVATTEEGDTQDQNRTVFSQDSWLMLDEAVRAYTDPCR